MTCKDDDKLNEKIARIDRLEKRFSESFMTVQAVDERIAKTESGIEETKSSVSKIVAINDTIISEIEKLTTRTQSLLDAITSISAILDKQKPLHDQHISKYADIINALNAISSHSNKIATLEQHEHKFASVDTVETNLTASNAANAKIQKEFSQLRENIGSVQSSLGKLSEGLKQIWPVLDSLKAKHEILITEDLSLRGSIDTLRKETNNCISSLEFRMSNQIDQKIEEKLPKIDPDKTALKVKELIKNDLSSISIDTANASLKYGNLDAQVKMIEKKIENLFLTMKKIEIVQSQQEELLARQGNSETTLQEE